MDISHLLLYLLICILAIGFFAGTEIAFISANKLNLELKKKQGSLSGRILAKFSKAPEEFIGTSLIGVNILLVVYGLLMTNLNEHWMEAVFGRFALPENALTFIKLILDTLIATIIILIFAEFLPKAIFDPRQSKF